ncbi:hypothetical protein O59_000811 [Cellvibrio sp. BR]|nr:hypothetical protein O59_000811 [Cellvibrio sp. BR]
MDATGVVSITAGFCARQFGFVKQQLTTINNKPSNNKTL